MESRAVGIAGLANDDNDLFAAASRLEGYLKDPKFSADRTDHVKSLIRNTADLWFGNDLHVTRAARYRLDLVNVPISFQANKNTNAAAVVCLLYTS